ncbi:unnamed protein product [Orchesella dallaii]|uniref:Uncharacterized protein n=1 Tax=Orchesella dallaii TaxID=48710 RepID=A0ABP1R9C3_9HEXA
MGIKPFTVVILLQSSKASQGHEGPLLDFQDFAHQAGWKVSLYLHLQVDVVGFPSTTPAKIDEEDAGSLVPSLTLRTRSARLITHVATPAVHLDLATPANAIFDIDHKVTRIPINLHPPSNLPYHGGRAGFSFLSHEVGQGDVVGRPGATVGPSSNSNPGCPKLGSSANVFARVMRTDPSLVLPENDKYWLTSCIFYVLPILHLSKVPFGTVLQLPDWIAEGHGKFLGQFQDFHLIFEELRPSPLPNRGFRSESSRGRSRRTPVEREFKLCQRRVQNLPSVLAPTDQNVRVAIETGNSARKPDRKCNPCHLNLLQWNKGARFATATGTSETKVEHLPSILAPWNENVRFAVETCTSETKVQDLPSILAPEDRKCKLCRRNLHQRNQVQDLPSILAPAERIWKICHTYLPQRNENVGFATETGTKGTKVQDLLSIHALAEQKRKVRQQNSQKRNESARFALQTVTIGTKVQILPSILAPGERSSETTVEDLPSISAPAEQKSTICIRNWHQRDEGARFALETDISGTKVSDLPSKQPLAQQKCQICPRNWHQRIESASFEMETCKSETKLQELPSILAPAERKRRICHRN